LPTDGKVECACEAFEFAIDGRTFQGAAFIAKGGLLSAMVAIFLDQRRSDIGQNESPEECLRVFEIGSIASDRTFGNPCEV
jgi:hypothetical protein